MTENDLDQVIRIERENFKLPWKREFFLSDLNKDTADCLVGKVAGRVLGYVVAFRVLDELHLANISVDKKYQRKGIGTKLLATITEQAKEKGLKKIFLEVRKSNLKAQKFYEKFNFRYAYTRKSYYEDGEDALVYEKRINNNQPTA